MINYWDFQSIYFLKPIRHISAGHVHLFLFILFATLAQPVHSKYFQLPVPLYLFCHCEHTLLFVQCNLQFSRGSLFHCFVAFLSLFSFSFSIFRVTLHYAYELYDTLASLFYIFYPWQIDFATFTQTIIIYGINPYLSMSCKWSLLFNQNHPGKKPHSNIYSALV